MPEFPYEELRDNIAGGNGDYFNNAQDALGALVSHHLANGGSPEDAPTMDNVWLVRESDGGEVNIWQNEDGTYEGEEVDSCFYEAPGGFVNVTGFIGTKEARTSDDETYEDSWEMPRTEEELIEYHFDEDRDAMIAECERQKAEKNNGNMQP